MVVRSSLACTRRIAEAHSRSRIDPCDGTSRDRQNAQMSKRNSAQLQWRASSIRRTLAATLSGQLAKPSHLPVANRSSHHCTASDTVKDSSVIIACKAAPARCSVAAIVASRSPSAVRLRLRAFLCARRVRPAHDDTSPAPEIRQTGGLPHRLLAHNHHFLARQTLTPIP